MTTHLRDKNKTPNIVILTGAGISAESGLQTFRDGGGLWENHRIEDVATPEAFNRDPQLVYAFYNERRAQLKNPNVAPNAAHIALAKLEHCIGDSCLIVTQNVDDLHERAGSRNVIHMHGQLNSARCCNSNAAVHYINDFDKDTPCQCCNPPQKLRPDIVWFGEVPMQMERIISALMEADIFLSIGTSGNVYPAAGFVQQASDFGAQTIELNLEEITNNYCFNQHIPGLATQTVPSYVESLLSKLGSA